MAYTVAQEKVSNALVEAFLFLFLNMIEGFDKIIYYKVSN